jgi:hypothetical protein
MRLISGIFLMALAVCSSAQTKAVHDDAAKQQVPRLVQETLSIGSVELHLGMPQDAVLGQLTRAGYKLTGSGENAWMIMQSNGNATNGILGSVGFKNNKLTGIVRDWAPDQTTVGTIGNGIYGVLSNLYKHGRQMCSLQTGDQQNPTAEVKNIYLTCFPGASYVSITIVRYQGNDSVSVSEMLKAD